VQKVFFAVLPLRIPTGNAFRETHGIMKTIQKADFVPAERHIKLSSGDMVRILRAMKEWTQAELAERSGISVTDISLLENNRAQIGRKRAEAFARAFSI